MSSIEGRRKNLLAHLFRNFSRKNDCVPLFLYLTSMKFFLSFVILGVLIPCLLFLLQGNLLFQTSQHIGSHFPNIMLFKFPSLLPNVCDCLSVCAQLHNMKTVTPET